MGGDGADNHLEQLKDVIQDLYQIMVQVNSYDQANRPSKDILEHSMYVQLPSNSPPKSHPYN
jgi:hypothetical protein